MKKMLSLLLAILTIITCFSAISITSFAASELNIQFPLPAEYYNNVTAGFPYYSSGKRHSGIDYACPVGTTVFAAADGVVTKAGDCSDYGTGMWTYGNLVEIQHANGIVTRYGHNSQVKVVVGQQVKQSDLIALSGNTGNTTGPHCHFQVILNGVNVNPNDYLPKNIGFVYDNSCKRWFYYNEKSQKLYNKWQQDDGEWYYIKSDGYITTYKTTNIKRNNNTTIKGDFYFDGSGHLKTGAINDSSTGNLKYYAATSNDRVYQYSATASTSQYTYVTGQLYENSWIQVGNDWYFIGSNNEPVTYRKQINGKYYYFNGAGKMRTGAIYDSNNKIVHYANSDGVLYTNEWLQTGGYWYYMGSDSEPLTYRQQINGKRYYFDGRGRMQTGWIKISGKWYFFTKAGNMVSDCWEKIDGYWYHFDSSGAMQTGWQTIDGKRYYFNSNGAMRTD